MVESARNDKDRPAAYQVRVAGWIEPRWATWFEELTINTEHDDENAAITTLSGALPDQAALLGLLQKLYTLGLTLLLVRREEPVPTMGARERVEREFIS